MLVFFIKSGYGNFSLPKVHPMSCVRITISTLVAPEFPIRARNNKLLKTLSMEPPCGNKISSIHSRPFWSNFEFPALSYCQKKWIEINHIVNSWKNQLHLFFPFGLWTKDLFINQGYSLEKSVASANSQGFIVHPIQQHDGALKGLRSNRQNWWATTTTYL